MTDSKAEKIEQMNTELMHLLSKVRYREIEGVIGKTILISSLSSIREELIQRVGELRPGCGYLKSSTGELTGTLAKYSILDLRFATGQRVLSESDSVKRSTLRELGFLGRIEERKAAREVQEKDPTCIKSLLEAITDEKEWLLLYLTLESRKPGFDFFNATVREMEAGTPAGEVTSLVFHRSLESLHTRFPAQFLVHDACITNSDFAWFHKHFYL